MSNVTNEANPANNIERQAIPDDYIPMSAPIQRLQVPKKDGFVRYWFRGDAGRIQRAQQAGYRFVDPSEVKVNNFDLGGDSSKSGNTDLGSRVSIITGDTTFDGQPARLYLMEIREELYEKGQQFLRDANESVAAALRSGLIGSDEVGEGASDKAARYSKSGVPDFLNPLKRRR